MSHSSTTSRRDARICLALAVLCFACGTYTAFHATWLCLFGFYGAACLAWCTAGLYADHRGRLVQYERARRATAVGALPPPTPCCAFWRNSEGALHGPHCTRPSAARHLRDGVPLDERERRIFQALTADFHGRSAA
ncbi:hypothetical protein [Streptomyces sp. NPDC003832]